MDTTTATCPRCDHEPLDTACDEYQRQTCCSYVGHVDDLSDADSHDEDCVNAPAWMRTAP